MPVSSPFPIKRPEDDEGFDNTLEGDEERFMTGRDGDHLMCPYQCDLCHFRNIQQRDPTPGRQHKTSFSSNASGGPLWKHFGQENHQRSGQQLEGPNEWKRSGNRWVLTECAPQWGPTLSTTLLG